LTLVLAFVCAMTPPLLSGVFRRGAPACPTKAHLNPQVQAEPGHDRGQADGCP